MTRTSRFAAASAARSATPQTIADGLRGSIGVRNFELLRSHVDDVVTVSEAQIVAAMRVVLGDLKLLDRAVVGGAGGRRAGRQARAAPGSGSASCFRAAISISSCAPSCAASASIKSPGM